MTVKSNCKHFKGHIPCTPHKLRGVHCESCTEYAPIAGRILIIKLGAAGDVIRTTTILGQLRAVYPDHELWWLSDTPELVPTSVHKRLRSTPESYLSIQATRFDILINLDKDHHACALASMVDAKTRFGFTLINGVAAPANDLAEHKFITGLFDDVSQSNTKSYPQEILELCGFAYSGNEYEMDVPTHKPLTIPNNGASVIGCNTGCGDRWKTREWRIEQWEEAITKLMQQQHHVVLLGGPAEHDRNVELAKRTGAQYEGTFSLPDFIAVVNQCDVVVTAVTMAMHIAIGLKKPLVLMNNIFNKYEFELYGRGVLIEPEKPCTCYFQQSCTNSEYQCLEHLHPSTVVDAINQQLQPAVSAG